MAKQRVAARALEDLVQDVRTLADQLAGEVDREWWARAVDTFQRLEVLAKGGPWRVRQAVLERDRRHLDRLSKNGSRHGGRKTTAAGTTSIVPAAAFRPAI